MHCRLSDVAACLVSALIVLFGTALAGTARADASQPGSADAKTEVEASGVTLERIMADTDWLGGAPENPYWSADGSTIYFERDPADLADDDERLWRLDVKTGETLEVPVEDLGSVQSGDGDWSEDRVYLVYATGGDVFLLNVATDETQQLTRTTAREDGPFFLTGDESVAFQRDGAWLVRDLDSGLEYQPAEVVAGDDPAEEEPKDDFLSEQQRRLFQVVRDEEATDGRRQERQRELRRTSPAAVPPPFYLGKGKEILASSLSPTGDAILVLTAPEGRDEGRRDKMPNYVGADGYVDVREVRWKVGTGGDYTHALTLLDLEDHEMHEIDLSGLPGITDDPLAEIKAATEAAKEAAKKAEDAEDAESQDSESADDSEDSDSQDEDAEDGDSQDEVEAELRDVRIFGLEWSPDGSRVAAMVRSHDNKDRWIVLLSPEDPEPVTAHRLTMEGWINWSHNDFGWLPDGRLYYLSEETGYSHLYLYDPESTATTALTSGDFVVADPRHDPAGESFYVTANRDRPTSYDVFRVAAGGSGDVSGGDAGDGLERITKLGGLVDFELSPTGDRLLLRNSQLVEPPELFVTAAEPGAEVTQLTHTTSDEFEELPFLAPEIVQVPSSHHDRPIWGRYYAPENPELLRGADGKIPAVVFIHGAGYLQNAHEGWSGYFREFMFHTFLAQRGYAVLDLDYRGSKGYGADWRQAIYRHMGQPELEDLLDGRQWLASNHDVDADRVGIYGGSYGGFMVMMALFKEPGTFAAGAALRPVTDWAHYNHGYTSNILNTPDVDPEAYARSSPIEFAEGLEDPLLICAPMQDDNVFFQDVVRLVQKLIELDKTSFEVALFPVEPHGFRRPSSWLHEYRRIFGLFDEELRPVQN